MNKFEAKAAELVELGRKHGFDPEVTFLGEKVVFAATVRFNKNLYCNIVEIYPSGKLRVEGFDTVYGRSQRVSVKALPEYLDFYSEYGIPSTVGF
jgi:hypothetical protein